MGLLDRLLGRKQEEKPAPELEIGELDRWIAERIEGRKSELVEDLSNVVDEILKSRDVVEEVVRDLEEYEFPPELKKKVFKPVLTSKPAYVKGMMDALKGMGPENPETYEELREFYAAVRKAMKTIEKVQLGKGRYLVVTFREYMLKIGGALNAILDSLKAMKEELEEAEREILEMKSLAAEAVELRDKLGIINAPVRGEGVEELRRRKQRLEKELEAFLEGEEHLRFLELEKKLRDLEERESSLRMRVINIIGPLRRSFRKLRKLMDTGKVECGDRKILDSYLDAPFEAFAAEDEACAGIKSLLGCLSKAIEDGTLKLRKKERRKILSMAEVSAGKLRELRASFHRLRKEKAEVSRRLQGSGAPEARRNLERELAAVEEDLRRMKEERRARAEEVERLRKAVPAAMRNLEERIRELTGEKIRLRKPSLEG
jgi:hypothetical protein